VQNEFLSFLLSELGRYLLGSSEELWKGLLIGE
jgi:hypothetical protein